MSKAINIWKTSNIPNSKEEYLHYLTEIRTDVERVYVSIKEHIENLKQDEPSNIQTLVKYFTMFDEVNSATDRHLLNLFIYVNAIRVNHLKQSLRLQHNDEMMTLLQTITAQRGSLQTVSYLSFLEAYHDRRDKDMSLYNPCLAMMEKRTFRQLLDGLMSVTMICNYISKHLKAYNSIERLDINISHDPHGYI